MFAWNPQAMSASREEQLAGNPKVYTALERHEVGEWPVVTHSELRMDGMTACTGSI